MRSAANYEFQGYFIPARMEEGLKNWVVHGTFPGSFLQAVLENDLVGAMGKADSENLANLPAYGSFLYNELPAPCWGSKEKVERWAEQKAAERARSES